MTVKANAGAIFLRNDVMAQIDTTGDANRIQKLDAAQKLAVQ